MRNGVNVMTCLDMFAICVLNAIRTVCLCSFVIPPLKAKVKEKEQHCNVTCIGGTESTCGDGAHYNVFTTGLQSGKVAGDQYMGCYDETNVNSIFKDTETNVFSFKQRQSIEFPLVNTPSVCSGFCEKPRLYTYFLLSNGNSCYCELFLPTIVGFKQVDDSLCSVQCSGDANKYCGGVFSKALFYKGWNGGIEYNCFTSCKCRYSSIGVLHTIDCLNRNLTDLSTFITSNFKTTSLSTHLNLRDNFFHVLPNLTNFHITSLDISNNSLTTLDANLLPKGLKVLYADNNKLTTLNGNVMSSMQSLKLISLSENPWQCDCDLLNIVLNYKSKIRDLEEISCASSRERLVDMNEFCNIRKIIYFYFLVVLGFLSFVCLLSVYFNLHRTCINNSQRDSCDKISTQNVNDSDKCSKEMFMQRIHYDELALATDNWNQNCVLGEGGFGVVYKGNWRNTDVAIKRLKAEGVAEKVVNGLLQNPSKEIMYLNAIKHDNVLSMYGFCFHSMGSCLIYQFMSNGSLEDRLQCKNETSPLSWMVRGNIATGIARGLQFLHNVETPLIHGDIKSANILLDSNYEPRIGDFGLARTGPLRRMNKSVGFDVSHVYGTKPYLPDDFFRNKKLSTKVDTYSFGVVTFEMATGLSAFHKYKNYKNLKELVIKHDKSSIANIADKKAGHGSFKIFETLISLGRECVADVAEKRPEMVVVYKKLRYVLKTNVNNVEANNEKYNNASNVQLKPLKKETKNLDILKLDERKAALLLPLNEIPSISNLYSSPVHEADPRKIISADVKNNSYEISDDFLFTVDF